MTASTAPRTTNRDLRREDTRRRIYQAAMDIFNRDGYSAARIDDIAEAAGVSHGAFYFHFPTKEEVLSQCLNASEARVAAVVGALPAETRIEAVLEAIGEAVAREWQDDRRLFPDVAMVAFRYFTRTALVNDGGSARSAGLHPHTPGGGESGPGKRPASPVALALAPWIRAAAERGELAAMLPAELVADLFLVNIFAATLAWCSDPVAPLPMTLAGVTHIFLDGVRGGAASPPDLRH